ncbi:hypothetical protein C3L33_15955, partial [Rhododendron williamsianum]
MTIPCVPITSFSNPQLPRLCIGCNIVFKRSTEGFGENCTPRGQCTFGARLQEDEIKVLAEFVKSQADLGWPN